MKYERISLFGIPGGGKSTFARKLSQKTGQEIIYMDREFLSDLDKYFGHNEVFSKWVKQQSKKDSWIMDGNYKEASLEIRKDRSDLIIFFDMPTYLALYRVMKRSIVSKFKRRVDVPTNFKDSSFFQFIKHVKNYNAKNRKKFFSNIDDYSGELIIVKSKKQAAQLLDQL